MPADDIEEDLKDAIVSSKEGRRRRREKRMKSKRSIDEQTPVQTPQEDAKPLPGFAESEGVTDSGGIVGVTERQPTVKEETSEESKEAASPVKVIDESSTDEVVKAEAPVIAVPFPPIPPPVIDPLAGLADSLLNLKPSFKFKIREKPQTQAIDESKEEEELRTPRNSPNGSEEKTTPVPDADSNTSSDVPVPDVAAPDERASDGAAPDAPIASQSPQTDIDKESKDAETRKTEGEAVLEVGKLATPPKSNPTSLHVVPASGESKEDAVTSPAEEKVQSRCIPKYDYETGRKTMYLCQGWATPSPVSWAWSPNLS